jgi:GNAT superfamily N-acetyltransferase
MRKALITDAEGILSCLAVAFAPYRGEYTPEAFEDTVLAPHSVRRRLSEMCVFVAECLGQVVGTIGCQVRGAEGHLRGMAVLPEWQATGLASALLERAEAELHQNGCTCVTLDTTAPLKRAIRFYERHGFSATGRVSDFFGMDVYEYVKTL